jgi:hypothetical protein
MLTCLTRPITLLTALLLTTSCADDATKADPFELNDPHADMSAPDMSAPDMDTLDPDLNFSAITVGAGHICAITRAGALYCWGRNTSGQVGVGSDADSVSLPTLVPGMERDVIAVSAAGQSTCAIKGESLYCWGDNTAPLVADKPALLRTPTLNLVLERGVTAVSTSGSHTCAVRASKVYCWGENDKRQLGYEVPSQLPNIIEDMTGDATSVSVYAERSCAASGDAVWCWGDNTAYLNGAGTPATQLRPTAIADAPLTDPPTPLAIKVGLDHACIGRGGELSCWGGNSNGQLGTLASEPRNSVHNSIVLTNVSTFALGPKRACALVDSGAYCWGDLTHGVPDEPGQPPLRAVIAPLLMDNLERGVSAIATGPYNTCAIHFGHIMCMGDAQFGQMPRPSLTPIRVVPD